MRVVVKISGHLIYGEKGVSLQYVKDVASMARRLSREGYETILVCGGGVVARSYISVARRLGVNEGVCDLLGIYASRINARLVAAVLGEAAYPRIPETLEEAVACFLNSRGRVLVLGGFQPGQSTTTVAALTAEAVSSDLLVLTSDVEGIYTADPKKDPSARLLDEVTLEELERIFSTGMTAAGTYQMLDPLTLNVLKRARLPTRVVLGQPVDNILRAVHGERVGTLITYTKK